MNLVNQKDEIFLKRFEHDLISIVDLGTAAQKKKPCGFYTTGQRMLLTGSESDLNSSNSFRISSGGSLGSWVLLSNVGNCFLNVSAISTEANLFEMHSNL